MVRPRPPAGALPAPRPWRCVAATRSMRRSRARSSRGSRDDRRRIDRRSPSASSERALCSIGPLYDHGRRGTGLVAHPVFKTGRAGQPPAWKVRFLRRVVAGLSPLWRAPCTAQLSRCDSVSGCVGAVRGGTTGVTKTSWCRSAPQFPAGGRAEEARAGKRWSVGRCEADRPNAGSRLEEPRSAHSLRDRGVGQIPSCPRGSARRARLCHGG